MAVLSIGERDEETIGNALHDLENPLRVERSFGPHGQGSTGCVPFLLHPQFLGVRAAIRDRYRDESNHAAQERRIEPLPRLHVADHRQPVIPVRKVSEDIAAFARRPHRLNAARDRRPEMLVGWEYDDRGTDRWLAR